MEDTKTNQNPLIKILTDNLEPDLHENLHQNENFKTFQCRLEKVMNNKTQISKKRKSDVDFLRHNLA